MRNLFYFSLVFTICISAIYAQDKPPAKPTDGNTQTNTTSRQSDRVAAKIAAERQRRLDEEENRRQNTAFNRLKDLRSESYPVSESIEARRAKIARLYRKPTRKELRLLKPDPRDFQKYAKFLKRKNTGLFKLVRDAGCSKSTKVIVVTPECSRYKLPGAGSSYSFRLRNYTIPRLSDLTLDGTNLVANGVLIETILVNLGDLSLETVDLSTEGFEFIKEFEPITTVDKGFRRAEILAQGVTHSGFTYSRTVIANEGATFALRSIAYRGKQLNAFAGLTYNELDFDRRIDITVVFRIVRKDSDGTITVIWNELQHNRAPKLKVLKNR